MVCLKCKEILEPSDAIYGLHEKCFTKWFSLPTAVEFQDLDRKATSKDPAEKNTLTNLNSSFFHGKFKKYSALLNGESYILKVREPEYPELPDVEYVCNQIGKLLEIPVPSFYLIEFHEARTFVTKNFVRAGSSMMNLTHIFHYFKENETLNCESIIAVLDRETKRYSDIDIFVKVCLFDALVGNSDRHGRNLGLLITPKATQLAPIYDNPSVLGLESGNMLKARFGPKGKIYTTTSKEPSMMDYIREFKRMGYGESIQDFASKVNVDEIHMIIEESFCTDLMKKALKRLITERALEMANEI